MCGALDVVLGCAYMVPPYLCCYRCALAGCSDWKTGDSLNYGFIGFDSEEACERVRAAAALR